MALDDYDLQGTHGAEVFRDLPEGLQIQMSDGSVGEIVGNPGDGAFVIVTIIEDADDPERVGQEETVFFADVVRVVGPEEEASRP